MKIKDRIKFVFIAILAISLLYTSCKKDNDSEVEIVNREIYKLMNDIYLWFSHLPTVDPKSFSSPYELMDALRYKELDRWSFVMTKEEYNQYFVQGEMAGHGFLLSKDDAENIRVAFVYRSTQAYANGVRRGWIIKKVNGTSVNSNNVIDLLGPNEIGINNTIEFINNTGTTVTLSLTKEVLKITPVLYSEVISAANKKIGYMVFQDFIETAIEEIDSTFTAFKNEGVDELIIDLRYNGGGSVDVALHLSGWLTGNTNANKTFVKFQHNEKNRNLDSEHEIPYNGNSFDFNRIVFIGTGASASASELLINGMKPYADVTLIGTPTEGKPVGMYVYVFDNYNYAVFPVSFKYTNANNVGDFYDGLQPDILVNDDITADFGDLDEDMLNTAVNYIISGGIPAFTKKTTAGSYILLPDDPLSNFLRSY